MRTTPPALLPLLRSQAQGDLLALTLLHPQSEFTLTQAAERIGASVKAVHQEANRLVTAGLLTERRIGRARMLKADTEHVLYEHLTGLLALTYGPMPVLSDALSRVEGVLEAYIYGSWAARYLGEPGLPPNDVDVLVVGAVDPDVLFDVASAAREVLFRDVNIHNVSKERWSEDPCTEPFLLHVKQRPLLQLRLQRNLNHG